jgi:hypothetical protein
MRYTLIVTFKDYITQKYIDWRKDKVGNLGSISRFARDVVDVTPQLLSEWMNRGKVPSDDENIQKLERAFSNDKVNLYSALGIVDPMMVLPPKLRSKVEAALAEINEIYRQRGVSVDSEEAEQIADEVFGRIGLIKKES